MKTCRRKAFDTGGGSLWVTARSYLPSTHQKCPVGFPYAATERGLWVTMIDTSLVYLGAMKILQVAEEGRCGLSLPLHLTGSLAEGKEWKVDLS